MYKKNMSSSPREVDTSSMFMQKGDGSCVQTAEKSETSSKKPNLPPEVITVKDFFDFMKTAYQVYEHLEGDDDETAKINWDKLTKLTVINHVIEQQERDLLKETVNADPKPSGSKSETALMPALSETHLPKKRLSCSEIDSVLNRNVSSDIKVEMLGIWTEANLNCKLNDVINEGILDSILPYLVGYKKPSKTSSVYTPVIKKTNSTEIKKQASFGGFLDEKESKDRLGRRKSAVAAAQEQLQKQEGEVEIHVCDEVKGLKKDFKCPQKLLITKMGYFADVTAGQRLEDMDISVHCDIQIFDWLMRWVKRDTILVADWPLLEPTNVVPILVSASFLQMEPLLHDCLIYCHAHMSEIVKTATNLACLSDALLTRLAAMYTNIELEAIRDRKDKIQSRLYCKMILSLAEPVPETIRGHYATLANLFKCTKCNKLLGRHIADQVPCQPSSMRIDRRGNVLSTHTKDTTWNLNEYITWLYGDLRSWRRVYWRLWADCHFLKCQLCDNYFPAYQMDWCSYHEQMPHMFHIEGRPPLPSGKYPCCGESAYRFETITRNTGCQFREHAPHDMLPKDAAVVEIYNKYRELIAIKPPQLKFPERIPKFVAREPEEEANGRLECKEVFWWEGIQLVPARQPFGLLGKMYSSNNKFNPSARPGSPPPQAVATKSSSQSLTGGCSSVSSPPTDTELKALPAPTTVKEETQALSKKGTTAKKSGSSADHGDEQSESSCESDEDSDSSEASERSEEDSPPKNRARSTNVNSAGAKKRTRVVGRQWVTSLSARSNQDGQRRFEERALRQMRAALARRTALSAQRPRAPPGGVYPRLEVEWRERHGQPQPRLRATAVPMRQRQQIKYK